MDVRVIAATHRDLAALVAEGRIREDFYYRLRVFPIDVPPLRDRREDVPALAAHLLAQIRMRAGHAPSGFTREAMQALAAAPWPGNVRQLRNAVEYAAAVAQNARIEAEDLPSDLTAPFPSGAGSVPPAAPPRGTAPPSSAAGVRGGPPFPSRGDVLAEETARALRESGGRVGAAAARLGISRVTLWRRLRRGRG